MSREEELEHELRDWMRRTASANDPMAVLRSVLDVTEQTPQRVMPSTWFVFGRTRRTSTLAGVGVLAAIVLIAGLGWAYVSQPRPGTGGVETIPIVGSASPTSSAQVGTPVRTAPPKSEAATPTPEPLASGSFVTVVLDLTVRTEPRGGARQIAELPGGLQVFVVEGPVLAVGGTWYRIEYEYLSSEALFGWVAYEERGGVSNLEQARQPRCSDPDRLDATVLSGHSAAERLLCFGNRELELGPVVLVERGEGTPLYVGRPRWLAERSGLRLEDAAYLGADAGALPVQVPPGVQPEVEQWLTVSGHFDDPRSAECVREPVQSDLGVQTRAEQVLWCRQQFVITDTRPSAPLTLP